MKQFSFVKAFISYKKGYKVILTDAKLAEILENLQNSKTILVISQTQIQSMIQNLTENKMLKGGQLNTVDPLGHGYQSVQDKPMTSQFNKAKYKNEILCYKRHLYIDHNAPTF